MIKRHYSQRLSELLKTFPLVTILGPRQCGKTSFIKKTLPKWSYSDLEKPSHANPFIQDPENRIHQLNTRFILDEAQQIPPLFPILRSYVDEKRSQKGRAVLLGSASPSLIKQISESLAGRTGFLPMTPLQWDELMKAKRKFTFSDFWLLGGFPDALLAKSSKARHDWFEAFTQTYLERDLTALQINVSSSQMRRLWMMLAQNQGGLWNASNFASALGVSYHTINRYTDILEQTYMVRKLQPYFTNARKRVTKSPKIYLRDSGLLHYFLGISSNKILDTHPTRGFSWEGFVIEQLTSLIDLFLPGCQYYFWRTSIGTEVDLIIQHGSRLTPFEIKLHSSPDRKMAFGLRSFIKEFKLTKGYVLYPGREDYSIGGGIQVLSVLKLLEQPKSLLKLIR